MGKPGWIVWLAVSCSGPQTAPVDSDSDADVDADSDTDTDADTDADAVAFVRQPTVSANDLGAGLTAWLDVQTTEPATLTVEVGDPEGRRSWTVDEAQTSHHHLLLGMKPDADHDVIVTAHAPGSSVTSSPMAWHSDALPPETPQFTVTGDPAAAEPGVTLFKVSFYLYMVDGSGEVVWFADAPELTHSVEATARGGILYNASKTTIEEISLSGEVLRSWRSNLAPQVKGAVVLDRQAIHHDVFEMPSGNLLTMGIEDRMFPDYPSSEFVEGPTLPMASVAGDVLMEFDPAGQVVNEWSLFDLLDPYRIGYDGLTGTYWDGFFGAPATRDWSHGNAVWYDDARDEVLISLRHQDAVVAIERSTSALSWIFAPTAHWPPALAPYVLRPELPTDLAAYHQHSASITPAGNLLMFDNGNRRASAWELPLPDEERFSRCLEASLDPANGTWTTVWSWGEQFTGEDSHLSGKVGDCDLLPVTGNHLITFGSMTNPTLQAAKVYEVDPDGNVVWTFAIENGKSPDQVPSMFRAERVTGLIPGR